VLEPVLGIDGVSKNYGGLRPLRVKELRIGAGERFALLGFDQPSAEMFVNLVTGQTLPDAGQITVFGHATSAIADSRQWLQLVDHFGIVSHRAVLLEPLTILQNLAIPFTLSVEPVADDVRVKAESLAREVGLPDTSVTVGASSDAAKMRVRLGRALALNPSMLLLEHVSAGLPAADSAALGADIAAVAQTRVIAVAALTADEAFARVVAPHVLRWDPASGRLAERRGWFGGRLG